MPDGGLAAAVRDALDRGGLTVEQVSAETRIRTQLVRDLLAGRTESSRGDAYVRGHLKAIAHATGADPDVLIAAYEAQTGSTLEVPDLEHTVHLEVHRAGSLALPLAERPERRSSRWGRALAAAAAVLAVLLVVGLMSSGRDRPPAAGASAASPSPVAAPVTTAPAPRPSGTVLRLAVTRDESWVQVLRGRRTVFEGVLANGATREFRDPAALSVKVGNAGAVSITCAGRRASAGASGQVRSFSCAPSGLSPV